MSESFSLWGKRPLNLPQQTHSQETLYTYVHSRWEETCGGTNAGHRSGGQTQVVLRLREVVDVKAELWDVSRVIDSWATGSTARL